jgi:hypothetical protein
MRIYMQDETTIGFECNTCKAPLGESESWINFTKTEKGGLYIDKFYGCCEPDLSAGNLRTLFAWMGDMVPVPAGYQQTCRAVKRDRENLLTRTRRIRRRPLNGRGKSDI